MFVLFLVPVLLFTFTNNIMAACTDSSMLYNEHSTTCNSLYDCNDHLSSLDIRASQVNDYLDYCEGTYGGNACTEIVNIPGGQIFVNCYNKINQPTPTTPPAQSCGFMGGICCQDEQNTFFCRSGQGGPKVEGTSCTCSTVEPTVVPTFINATPTPDPYVEGTLGTNTMDMFCDYEGKDGINTALGCVPVETRAFTMWLLSIMFGVGGGIAFLLMVFGFVVIMTSNGDPKKVQGGKETVTSAITGLLVIIFAVFLLRLIAYDILRIPGILK